MKNCEYSWDLFEEITFADQWLQCTRLSSIYDAHIKLVFAAILIYSWCTLECDDKIFFIP